MCVYVHKMGALLIGQLVKRPGPLKTNPSCSRSIMSDTPKPFVQFTNFAECHFMCFQSITPMTSQHQPRPSLHRQ